MRERRLFFLIFLVPALAGCGGQAAPAAAPVLAAWDCYPKTHGIAYVRARHSSPGGWDMPNPERAIVAVTWFLHGEGPGKFDGFTAMEYAANAGGRTWKQRKVYGFADQATRQGVLDPSQGGVLVKLAASLPRGTAAPPIARLVVVSHWVEGRWHTDTYDQAALPPAVEQIVRLFDEQLNGVPEPPG